VLSLPQNAMLRWRAVCGGAFFLSGFKNSVCIVFCVNCVEYTYGILSMNLEVYEGATTAKEAVDAGKRARQQRFSLYTDLHSPKGVRSLFAHLPHEKCLALANQITQAMQAKGGFPEFLARKVEEAAGLPFGYLDQPYPYPQLRASLSRARRLKRMADGRGDAAVEAIGRRNFEQLEQACYGFRGVSEEFYEKARKKLKKLAREG